MSAIFSPEHRRIIAAMHDALLRLGLVALLLPLGLFFLAFVTRG